MHYTTSDRNLYSNSVFFTELLKQAASTLLWSWKRLNLNLQPTAEDPNMNPTCFLVNESYPMEVGQLAGNETKLVRKLMEENPPL